MERQKRAVVCGENVAVADCMWDKRQEIAESPKGISDNLDATLYKAYCNLCNCKTPIKTLKELSEIKGIGKWMVKLMQGFFASSSATSDNEDPSQKGKSNKGKKRYVPQKNSVAYALLVTLYRAIANGKEFMRRQELIDSAEASGLSRVSIAAEKGKGKAGNLGNSPQGWYSGWSCMKTLITRGLVVKSSNPAKYMLTEEGKEAARECISRSGLVDSDENIASSEVLPNLEQSNTNIKRKDTPDLGQTCAILSPKDVASPSDNSKRQKKSIDIPQESLDKFLKMGFSQEIVISAYAEVSKRSRKKDVAALWPAVLCHLREGQIYGQVNSNASEKVITNPSMSGQFGDFNSSFLTNSSNLQPCSSNDYTVNKQIKSYVMPLPPLEFGERFQEVYEVILILDDREHFATQGSRSRKLIESVCSQFKIQIEVRRLPIGDCIWIARNKTLKSEYVLDFIVERKKIDDLRISIRDNRYKDQKLRLLRCGLKKMIYLVEGDPNFSEAAESIKTACFTTEISEGFDVQRTSGLGDTLRKYGHLTQAIKQYYYTYLDPENKSGGTCVSFTGFLKRCQDLDKLSVSDVFAIQLMQVPHVTEDIAIAVLDMYPTLISLASAYSLLDGDVRAQEEMLKKKSNNLISGIASRNIFQLVWAD